MQNKQHNNLLRFWPAALGAVAVYALWPLLWLGLNASALSRQEPKAGELFAAAPAVYFTGKLRHFQAGGEGGRYLMRDAEQIKAPLMKQGWNFTDQMGGAYIFEKDGKKIGAVCRKFSLHFSVCTVS